MESVENISLYDIEKFENEAREIYKLTNFKIDYKYVGDRIEIDERKVRDIINDVTSKYIYTYPSGKTEEKVLHISRNTYYKYKAEILNELIEEYK